MKYDFRKIEKKWQKKWKIGRTYEPDLKRAKKPFYNLMMFPYPSAEGLHVGNMYAFTGSDVYGRMKRMQGYDVLEPIGLDGFGIHSENYAMKAGRHPVDQAKISEKNFYRQLESIGNGFAWGEKLETYDPEYYRTTQWIFTEMWRHGLAYRKKQPVNWCPSCKTVLADEQVILRAAKNHPESHRGVTLETEAKVGVCERCDTPVIKKDLEQWFFRITNYAERLLGGLQKLDWAEKVKIAQRNWIGKSEGAEIDFEVKTNEKPNFVLLHGWRGSPKRNFFPWLKGELERRGYQVQAPELPDADDPKVYDQVAAVLKQVSFDSNTVVVAHSLGGVVAMKTLERLPKPVRKTVLIASFTENRFSLGEDFEPAVFDWKFDFSAIAARAGKVSVVRDLGDDSVPHFQADVLAKKLGVEVLDIQAQAPHVTARMEPDILPSILGSVRIFTTRPDTLFGATYLVVAPEHPLISNFQFAISNQSEVDEYISAAKSKLDEDRIAEGKDPSTGSGQGKTGVELKGVKAINPATKEEIPVWVADYVLRGYGTGAIMAVPAHDERDFEFAKKYKLPIKQVIAPETGIRRENEEWRDGGCGVVFDPKVQKYAVARWSNGQFGLFAGGVERGEDEREGILREVTEESGLYDFAYVERIRKTFAHFYNPVKKVNRITLAACYLVVLKSSNARPLKHEDHETFEVGWAGAGEVLANLENYNREGNHDHWIDFLKQAVGRAIELGYDTVSDPKVFRASAYVGIGTLLDSGKFDSMPSEEARWKITEFAGGNKKIQYRLRDWLISRQRYWGPPIPMIHCEACAKAGKGEQPDMPGWYAVPKEDLPVKLPYVENFRPTGTGKSPLASVESFYKARCPGCNGWARRETDVSDTFLDSAWYYIGYLLQTQSANWRTKLKTKNWDRELIKKWLPVDMYIGGAEHSVLHLLYVRFLAKAFKDWGLVHFEEPMTTFRAHGLIVKDGAKMSKSKGNIVSPDFFIEKFGADTLRMYLMFLGPFEDGGDFRDQGILGPHRFLERVWKMGEQVAKSKTENLKLKTGPSDTDRQLHRAIKKVTEDIQGLHHNTAISTLMILLNEFEKQPFVSLVTFNTFLQLLAPFAPHITEELWQELNANLSFQSIHNSPWPKFNPKLIREETIELIIQVNGKLRGRITVSSGTVQADAERLALENIEVKKWVPGTPRKVIFVPGRMINFVV